MTTEISKLLVIVGSAKCGTTSLAHHLAYHPDMVLGREKEPRYFTDFSSMNWSGPASKGFVDSLIVDHKNYVSNFLGLTKEKWAIDASTDYIWCAKSPELLNKYKSNCEVRLLCIVRDPIERAISEYNHTLRHNWENLTFGQSLNEENKRIKDGWQPIFHHKRRSTISDDIFKYLSLFDKNVLIVDYAELEVPSILLPKIYQFLEISPQPHFKIERLNESLLPRNNLSNFIVNNRLIRNIVRNTFPKSLRSSLWNKLHTNSRNTKTVKYEDIQYMKQLLAEEIEKCVNDPTIPTVNWSCLKSSS